MPNIGTTSRLAFIVSLDNSNFLRNSEILERKLGAFGVKASRLGQGLTRSLSLLTGILEGFAVSAASQFDEIASQLQAVTGGEGFGELIENARKLGRSTKFTATEVLTLTRELSKLGLSVDEVGEGVGKTIGVVTVFGGDLVKTGDAIAGLTRQFTDLTFAKAADVLAVAFRKTALGTDNFREAFKNVGAVANQTGLSFERTVAALGVLANSAQRGGIAGNRLKTVLAKLAENGYDASEGLLAVQAGGNDFATLLDFFKQRGVVAAGSIQELGLEMEELVLRLEDVDGAAEGFQDIMRDKLFFSVARTKAAIEDLGISLGYALSPVVQRAADILEYLADNFAKLNFEEAQALAGNALFIIALGPLIFALGQAAIAIQALLTPTGALVGVLFLVGAAIVRTQAKLLLLRTEFRKNNKVVETYRDLLKGVGGDLGKLSASQLEAQLSALKGLFEIENEGTAEETLGRLTEQTSFEKAFTDLNDFVKTIASINLYLKDTGTIGAKAFDTLAAVFGLSADDVALFDLQLAALEANRLNLVEQIAAIQAELATREAERARIAAERLAIARELGLLSAEDLKANEDLFAQTIDKLKGAVSEFAVSAEQAKRAIGDLNQLDLATFEEAMIGKFPKLLDEFGGLATVFNELGVSAEGARAVEKQFRGAAEAFLKLGNQKIADFFIRLANSYESTAEAFEQSDLVKTIQKNAEALDILNIELEYLGRQGLSDSLNSKLSETKRALEELLAIPVAKRTDSTQTQIENLNNEVNDLEDKLVRGGLVDAINDILGGSSQDFGADLINPFAAQDTASATSNRINKVIAEITSLRENLKKAREEGVNPLTIAMGEAGLAARLKELQQLFQEVEVNKFNDGLADVESRLKALGALEAEGLVSGFDAAKERVKLLTEQIEKATILTDAGVIIDPDKVADLKERLKEATQELRNFYLAGLLLRAIQGFANQIADAFRQAKEEGRRFGEVLKESLQRTFRELIAKLIVLTSLFLLLSVLSGGTGAIAGVARNAISGGFGSFIGEGLIGGGPGIRNLGITGGGGGAGSAPSLRVEGFLSGNNVVIANQRGTRAIDRTFG
jgi:hypothetical protein